MKSQEAIDILKKCYNEEFYYVPQETGIYLIETYIFEKTEVLLKVNPPDNMLRLQYYSIMLDEVFNYYLKE